MASSSPGRPRSWTSSRPPGLQRSRLPAGTARGPSAWTSASSSTARPTPPRSRPSTGTQGSTSTGTSPCSPPGPTSRPAPRPPNGWGPGRPDRPPPGPRTRHAHDRRPAGTGATGELLRQHGQRSGLQRHAPPGVRAAPAALQLHPGRGGHRPTRRPAPGGHRDLAPVARAAELEGVANGLHLDGAAFVAYHPGVLSGDNGVFNPAVDGDGPPS